MLEKYARYDFRLDEDAEWLLKNRPLDVDWGFDWFRGSEITRKHYQPDASGDYPWPWLIIASRLGNAGAQVELLTELADWMCVAVEGAAVSDDDQSFVLIADTIVADWGAPDPGREALTDFVRAAWFTTKYRLPPGHLALRMLWEGRSPFDDWGTERVPKAWT